MRKLLIIGMGALVFLGACKKEEATQEEPANIGANSDPDVPAVYAKIYGATDIYRDGDFVVIETGGTPDHKSPYYLDTQWESSL